MKFQQGHGWKASYDETTGKYTAEYGGCGDYHLYEITKEIFDSLKDAMSERDACELIGEGRHLYIDVNDRCGPHYTAVFDHDYDKIAPWANVVSSGTVMPDALTDAAVRLFASEEKNREHRVEKAEHENKNNEGENRR